MPKKIEPEGFEVTEYSGEKSPYDKYAAIRQIVEDKVHESPAVGCHASCVGNLLKVTYTTYVMCLPTRMPAVQDEARSYLNGLVSHIKKEFRARGHGKLELKEDKSLTNYTVQKVSLNERYHYAEWRCYEIG